MEYILQEFQSFKKASGVISYDKQYTAYIISKKNLLIIGYNV